MVIRVPSSNSDESWVVLMPGGLVGGRLWWQSHQVSGEVALYQFSCSILQITRHAAAVCDSGYQQHQEKGHKLI